MKPKLFTTLFAAAAAGAMLVVPAMGTAAAAAPTAHQSPWDHDRDDNDWGGFNRPGWADPNDPWRNDWHCDRHGRWHDHERDRWGHDDGRCHAW
ncbi:MAG: hypothetical protein JWN03_6553 [Nocardia sp.]|uniref:hypothetical protein n=1 Tax=Nocardia sp. TaxID=1821 RepID=UPI0026087B4D|nr:hypothetical protein [Nocardia sp.]MCU1646278.1 hypothetical protein [Nocardia sp.]